MSAARDPPAGAGVASRHGWYVLALLFAAHVLGYIDRWILSLLIEPLKADLKLSDFQIGLLIGPAFAMMFITLGIPFGWLADRVDRRRMLAGGIALWCLFTAGSCLASSFATLFAMRLGVGIGEAVLAPCAFSLIADHFRPAQRSRAVSLFMAGTFTGAGSAFLIGGPLITALKKHGPVDMPLVGLLQSWQVAFLSVGLPGLIVAALVFFTVREPPRREVIAIDGQAGARGLRVALRYVGRRWAAFGTVSIGAIGNILIGSNAQWIPSLFDRNWGWQVGSVARAVGLLFFVAGPIGTIVAIRLTSRLSSGGRRDAGVRALCGGVGLLAISFALLPLAPYPALALVALFGALLGQAIATASGPASIILIAPGNIRGQLMSFYYLANGLVASFLGAPVVGALADRLGPGRGLGHAITIVSAVVGTIVVLILLLGRHHYLRTADEVQRLTTAPR